MFGLCLALVYLFTQALPPACLWIPRLDARTGQPSVPGDCAGSQREVNEVEGRLCRVNMRALAHPKRTQQDIERDPVQQLDDGLAGGASEARSPGPKPVGDGHPYLGWSATERLRTSR